MGKRDEPESEEEAATHPYLNPVAQPLIEGKLLSKATKLIEAAGEAGSLVKGIPEVTKAIRKKKKGVVFLGGDIFPLDVFAHLPIHCENHQIYYAYLRTRAELGAAYGSDRPCSCVFVEECADDGSYFKTYNQVAKALKEVHPYM